MKPLASQTKAATVLITVSILLFYSCTGNNNKYFKENILRGQWKMLPQDKLNDADGEDISAKGFNYNDWHNATVPGTVMGSLTANSEIEDPYFGINMKKIDISQFEQPWWYRTTFNLLAKELKKEISLRFKGINYRADLWINGKKVIESDRFAGAFRMFSFKINKYAIEGENVIALKISPPAKGEYSIGFVDWNPVPPDHNMGIFRDVVVEINEGVKIRSPFVYAKIDKKSLSSAELTIQAELENNSEKNIVGKLKIDFGLGSVEKDVELKPGECTSCIFTPEEYMQLAVENAKLWWPNGMGEASLYPLKAEFISNNKTIDKVETKYGIREIENYLDENGNRAFNINGKFVLLKGAGWVDDLLLQDTKESVEAQLKYVKHMNLNSIRLEGFWGKDESLYDLCDQYGIMIMAGWSCHWEWDEYLGKETHPKYGGPVSDKDIELIANYWHDQMLWLRNHPSIYVWMLGSDKLPAPKLEQKYIDLFKKYDPSRPYITSAGGVGSDQNIVAEEVLVSDISGPTGMKMLGPYAYTPPVYWHTDTTLGGAYGFNTETCPGPNVPPLSSLKKMLPEDKLWPIDKEYWEYHCGRNAFSTLDRYRTALYNRYREPTGVEDFAFKSQIMNYELMRPMFEAFIANKPKSTGLVQWMLNSAWPEMYWQLYDSYLQPNGAFYAVKKACNPIHAIYRYGHNDIFLGNEDLNDAKDISVDIKAFNLQSKEVFSEVWKGDIKTNTSKSIYQLPEIDGLTSTWFLSLKTYDANNNELDNNFYWLSQKDDVLDYKAAEKLEWPYYTPSKEYADFSGLKKLPVVRLNYDYKYYSEGDQGKVIVKVTNPTDTIAFFIYFEVIDPISKGPVLPIFWNDNYVTLLPGEEQTYNVTFSTGDLKGKEIELKIKGWNIEPVVITTDR